MIEQSIHVKIKTKEGILGTLKISSDINSELDNKFKSIETKKVKGMTLNNIKKDYALDTYTPIQYCVLSSYSTDIFLLEETEYTFSFELNKKITNLDKLEVFDHLRKHVHGRSNFRFSHLKDVWIANVNFRGFAGKTFINIIYEDVEIYSLMVEVRTKKLGYDNEYSQMIADLAKYSSGLLFNVKSSLYQNYILPPDNLTRGTLYEYYMLLEYLFRPENLPSVSEYLSRNLYSLLENTSELVPTPLVSNIGANEIAELSSNPHHISETTKQYSIYNDEDKYYIPLMINEMKYVDNINVPENRFYKYFLEFIRDLINKLYHENPDAKQVKLSLKHYNDIINSILSHKYFKDISRLDYVSLNSQVLQKKEGYREILQYYLMFEFGLKISFDDLTDEFRGYQKELSKVYEIWQYFQLIEILNAMTVSDKDLENFVDTENWTITLENIKKLDYFKPLVINDKEIEVILRYNYSFESSETYKNGDLSTYSEQLDPDYTIQLKYENTTKFIHFDAKYKIKKGTYKKEDIHKMHTYKDGINDTLGAFVLYPGENPKTIYYEKDGCFGAVGALCLKPGTTNKNQKEIKKFIKEFVREWLETFKKG